MGIYSFREYIKESSQDSNFQIFKRCFIDIADKHDVIDVEYGNWQKNTFRFIGRKLEKIEGLHLEAMRNMFHVFLHKFYYLID